jgi:nitric oxide reductase NorD protein
MTTRQESSHQPRLNAASYELYYLALSGRVVTIEPTPDAEGLHHLDSERTLRLPVPALAGPGIDAESWRRVALAHRALHHEMGTFTTSIETADPRIRDVLAGDAEGRSPLERFFRCFAERRLAISIFQTLEDLRVDAALPVLLPGLGRPLERVLAAAAAARPPLASLAPRAAAMEVIIRCSLAHPPGRVPRALGEAASLLCAIAQEARDGATVAATILATVRAYAVVSRLPNLGVLSHGAVIRVPAPGVRPWPSRWPEPARESIEGDAILDVTVVPVPHRDDLSARLTSAPPPAAPSQQAVYRWSAGDPAALATPSRGGVAGPPEPLPHEHPEVAGPVRRLEWGPLRPEGPHTFVYPEWDAPAGRYLPRWCRVIEDIPREADPRAIRQLQVAHQLLVARLRRVMQSAAPRGLTRQGRMHDGDDIDIDAAVEAVVELHTGRSPRIGVYETLVPRRRSVAVGVLIDASSSTGERVLTAPPLVASPDTAQPLGYRDHPRILDVEVLSGLLCLTAIDAVEDASAAWVFSGTGRDGVRLTAIKTLAERLGPTVFRRAAAVRPGGATRLGAAIRHATARLAATPAARRVLLVLSDGRPFDSDYGQRYGEQHAAAYAAADTRRAVIEARDRGLTPFLLTIGAREGAEASLADVPGEVLDDLTQLPARLTRLYRELSAATGGAWQRRPSLEERSAS